MRIPGCLVNVGKMKRREGYSLLRGAYGQGANKFHSTLSMSARAPQVQDKPALDSGTDPGCAKRSREGAARHKRAPPCGPRLPVGDPH